MNQCIDFGDYFDINLNGMEAGINCFWAYKKAYRPVKFGKKVELVGN